jgi:hypothetical protein
MITMRSSVFGGFFLMVLSSSCTNTVVALDDLNAQLLAARALPRGSYRYLNRTAPRQLRGTTKSVLLARLGSPDYCDVDREGAAGQASCATATYWSYFFAPDTGVIDDGDGTLTVTHGGIDALEIAFGPDQRVSSATIQPQK